MQSQTVRTAAVGFESPPAQKKSLSDSAFVGIFHESAPRKAHISRPGHRSSAFRGDMIETSHNSLGQVGELERCLILPTG